MWIQEERPGVSYQVWTQLVGVQLYALIRGNRGDYRAIRTASRRADGGLNYGNPFTYLLLESDADWRLAWHDLPAFLMEELL